VTTNLIRTVAAREGETQDAAAAASVGAALAQRLRARSVSFDPCAVKAAPIP